jgi:hypothetical protein
MGICPCENKWEYIGKHAMAGIRNHIAIIASQTLGSVSEFVVVRILDAWVALIHFRRILLRKYFPPNEVADKCTDGHEQD